MRTGTSLELVIIGLVRDWAFGHLAADDAVTDAAIEIALKAHAGGASVREACAEARQFIEAHDEIPPQRAPLIAA